MKTEKQRPTQFAVIGLGTFGQSVVCSLAQYGVTILACDSDEEKLHTVTGYATHLVKVDATDEESMVKLGLGNFDAVIITVGEGNLDASLMATMSAKETGAKNIVVKAYTLREKKLLESIGATHVVVPELEMGAKLAHRLVRPNILDVLEDSESFQITEMHPMEEWVGKSVREADIRNRYKTSILAIIRNEKRIFPVRPEEVIEAEDILVAMSES